MACLLHCIRCQHTHSAHTTPLPVYCVGTTVTVQKEESKQDVGLLNPQERVSAVRPMWEQRSHADRVELLTVALSSLKQEAEQQAEKARATAGVHAYGQ